MNSTLERSNKPRVDYPGQCGSCDYWTESCRDPEYGTCAQDGNETLSSDGCRMWRIHEFLRIP